jgi:hypothetical protein
MDLKSQELRFNDVVLLGPIQIMFTKINFNDKVNYELIFMGDFSNFIVQLFVNNSKDNSYLVHFKA